MEEKILEFWERSSIFQKSIDIREGCEEFVFYDGPPFATGLPHFGHFVPGTIKDIIPRFQTMRGKRVIRRFGWDCHGLPVEYEIEKDLGISGKTQIEAYGVAAFNERCRSIVLRYTDEWRRIVTRLGRWVDFDHDYKTMDPDYMESIWWVFRTLWEKGYIYEGYNILPYSPALSSPLSNFEVNLGGYQDVSDPAITVRFKVKDQADTYLLAWTTTPWTLPSNLALALGPEIDYVKVTEEGVSYILAASKVAEYFKNPEGYEITCRCKGRDLEGLSYEPLMPFFSRLQERGAFRTFLGDHVSEEEGCGIVHTAPGFGEEDYQLLKHTDIPVVCPIDAECRFTDEVPDWQGRFVKDADDDIIRYLKEQGKLVKKQKIMHSYPFCYRTRKPLIYRALSCWFVDVGKIKSDMLEANEQIRWVPDHLKHGRFGKWLEGARDWAISRNRYWGNPIPVWKCDGSDYFEVIGSRAELEMKSGIRVDDLHKHFVDEITWPSPDGKGTMRRIPDVLDCWFESGSMPYAQNHYPFENKDYFESNFPADFICEGLDQTRGWFYTLTIIAAGLFQKPAFYNCITNGLVLAPDGKKMSKSLRNYSDPVEVVNSYGADALRFFLMNSAVVRAEDLRFSDEGVREVLKSFIIPLWNAYSFFVTYAGIDGWDPQAKLSGDWMMSLDSPLDRWIISESERLVQNVTEALDSYELQRACQPIVDFIDLLNNWYIRRSRRRFWRSENDTDKDQAYRTLYSVLLRFIHVAAPFIPFTAEEIYLNLRTEAMAESIHLACYPEYRDELRDRALEKRMALTKQTVTMGRALRSLHSLKTRQPLQTLYLVNRDDRELEILREMDSIIRQELNVKESVYRTDESDLVTYSAKANFKVLGRTLGKSMKEVAEQIQNLDAALIAGILDGQTVDISYSEGIISIDAESIVVQRSEREGMKVLNEGAWTVGLDSRITPQLVQEGIARDIIRSVQNLRKERGLEVTDRIRLGFEGPAPVVDAVGAYSAYIMQETLAEELAESLFSSGTEASCGDYEVRIDIVKSST